MTFDEMVSAEVRAEAARRRVTGARLAHALDLSPMSMSRRMNGHQPFTVGELAAIADELHVPIVRLLPTDGRARRDSNPQPTDYVLAA